MGHRRYVQELRDKPKQKVHDYTKTPNPRARNYFDEMVPVNGIIEYNESEQQIANRQREELRDAVSKRMGELLLRGVTMLDAYCQKCNGILMEDRNSVRNCVQCEVFAEKFGEVDRKVAMEIEQLGEKNEPISNAVTEQKVIEVIMEDPTSKSRQSSSGHLSTMAKEELKPSPLASKSSISLPGYAAAVAAIDSKLLWAANRLTACSNVTESLEYLRFIEEGMKILKCI